MGLKNQIKKALEILPGKKMIYSGLKSVCTPPESIYKHLYFKGVFNVDVEPGHRFKINHFGYQVENDIFWKGLYGGWERATLKVWTQLSKQADVILDVGANTGVYGLLSTTVRPKAQVFYFEPVKRICARLRQNLKLNEYEGHVYEAALSDQDGQGVIYDLPSEHLYSVTVNKNLNVDREVKEVPIQLLTLDSFIDQNNLSKIDLIKIDVETHEPQVLSGFKKHLPEFRPNMIIEILNNDVARSVGEQLKPYDYSFYYIDDINNKVEEVETLKAQASMNYLALRSEERSKYSF